MLLDSYEAWPSRCIKTNRYLGSIWNFFVLFIQFGCQKNCRIPKYSSMMMAKLSTKKISFEISIMRKILKTIPWNVMKWIYRLISQENRNARILCIVKICTYFFSSQKTIQVQHIIRLENETKQSSFLCINPKENTITHDPSLLD